jgi:8-amino-7-oxononanoate synthase
VSFPALDRYQTKLAGLMRRSRLRVLSQTRGVDFTSNDYLGLASAPQIAASIAAAIDHGIPQGAAGSRLLRGNHCEHASVGRKPPFISAMALPQMWRSIPLCRKRTI